MCFVVVNVVTVVGYFVKQKVVVVVVAVIVVVIAFRGYCTPTSKTA